jgi:hypothetical protein
MSVTAAAQADPLSIQELQNRASSAFSGSKSALEPAIENVPPQWSARRQLAFFLGAGAICWMLVLAPVLFL